MRFEGLVLVLLAGVNSCFGNLALKYSRTLAPADAGFLSKMLNVYFLLGLAFYGVNVVLFAKALDYAPVSIAYPVLAGSGFALLAIASAMLFGERISVQQIAGLLIVVVGIALLGR